MKCVRCCIMNCSAGAKPACSTHTFHGKDRCRNHIVTFGRIQKRGAVSGNRSLNKNRSIAKLGFDQRFWVVWRSRLRLQACTGSCHLCLHETGHRERQSREGMVRIERPGPRLLPVPDRMRRGLKASGGKPMQSRIVKRNNASKFTVSSRTLLLILGFL